MNTGSDAFFLSTEFTEYLFNNLDIAILIVDDERRIRRANDPFKSLFTISDSVLLNALYGDAMKCKFAHQHSGHCGEAEACNLCPIQQNIEKIFGGEQKAAVSYIPWEFFINLESSLKCER